MTENKEQSCLPSRRTTRYKAFDYSMTGVYFVTICTEGRKRILSDVIFPTVGEGLAPPERANPHVSLKQCGQIAYEQLKLLEKRYPEVTIDYYVIMPNHIHALIFLSKQAGGASPSPTLSDVVCAFKSLTSRLCKQKCGTGKLFQRSYFDHIIRNDRDLEEHIRYILENPLNWQLDELFSE